MALVVFAEIRFGGDDGGCRLDIVVVAVVDYVVVNQKLHLFALWHWQIEVGARIAFVPIRRVTRVGSVCVAHIWTMHRVLRQ